MDASTTSRRTRSSTRSRRTRPTASPEDPSVDRSLPRERRLRRSNDFQRVERQGQRASGALVVVVVRRGRGAGRVGFTVSKKVGNAVTRNAVKRRLREIARHHKQLWDGRDVVVIAKPEAAGKSLRALEADVLAALAKATTTATRRE